MDNKRGNLSINSENIFPIIKKWLYSDHDIFFREMISNGCDAITKLKKLEIMGEYSLPEDYKSKIEVIVNPDEKTLKFIDTGIGMEADEVEEYITQIAFSGATEFLEKYKDKTNDDQIIGHFGLGFTQHSWLLMRFILIRFLIKKGRFPFTGSVTEEPSMKSEKEIRQLWEQRLPCS